MSVCPLHANAKHHQAMSANIFREEAGGMRVRRTHSYLATPRHTTGLGLSSSFLAPAVRNTCSSIPRFTHGHGYVGHGNLDVAQVLCGANCVAA